MKKRMPKDVVDTVDSARIYIQEMTYSAKGMPEVPVHSIFTTSGGTPESLLGYGVCLCHQFLAETVSMEEDLRALSEEERHTPLSDLFAFRSRYAYVLAMTLVAIYESDTIQNNYEVQGATTS